MDLDETWQVGLRSNLSLARLQRNRAMGFGKSAKKWVAEALLFFVTETTHHSCHFPWIDFRQTFHEHVSRWWLANVVSHSRNVSTKGSNFPKNRLFRVLYGTLFVTRLRVTGNVLRRLHSFHPLVDIPQTCPT